MAAKSNQKRQSAPRTRREKLESREAAILDVAQKMIAERGFRKTTTAEIAAAADVAEGTLYLYFKNKEALGRAVLADFYRRLTENARRGVGKLTDTREKLAFLARHHLKNVIRERRILELVYMLERDMDSYEGGQLYQMNRAYVAVFDGVLREGVARGEIDATMTPWITRDIFYGSLEYAMRSMLIRDRRKSLEQVVSELVNLVMRTPSPNKDKAPPSAGKTDAAATRVLEAARKLESLLAAQEAKGENP